MSHTFKSYSFISCHRSAKHRSAVMCTVFIFKFDTFLILLRKTEHLTKKTKKQGFR